MKESVQILSQKRCIIGEGPIWNEREGCLYFTNGGGKELCRYCVERGTLSVRALPVDCAAYAFDEQNRLLVSCRDGVYILNENDTLSPLYDTKRYSIYGANDMKVGPDGRLYVGTQSSKRLGLSEKIDGKLYVIDREGNVRILLDGLILSNGMDWSMDETRFYHTDSDTGVIREYAFDKTNGTLTPTERNIYVPGVDGFTVDRSDRLYCACWGEGHIAVIDTVTMRCVKHIPVPCRIPASCGFMGEKMNILAVTTASLDTDIDRDANAGYTVLLSLDTQGRTPFIFGIPTETSRSRV